MMQKEKDQPVLSAACSALGQMGDRSERVRNALILQTEREGTEYVPVVLAACSALAQIGVADADVLDALNKALENKSLDSRAKDAIRKSIKDVQKPRDLKKKPKTPRRMIRSEPLDKGETAASALSDARRVPHQFPTSRLGTHHEPSSSVCRGVSFRADSHGVGEGQSPSFSANRWIAGEPS